MSVIQFPKKQSKPKSEIHTVESVLAQMSKHLISLSFLMAEENNADAERIIMAAALISIVSNNFEKRK